MRLPKFEYQAPKTLEAALELLAEKGEGAYVLAGGTDLLVKMTHGLLRAKTVIGLKEIEGLNEIRFRAGEGLSIGATALLADVASHPDILKHYSAVAYAAGETANVQVRNMGTVAGNLCNASPSADNAPTLMAMHAQVTLAGRGRERRVPLEQFFKGPGLTVMERGEIMTSIFVPVPPPDSGTSYKHISARGKVDMSAVCVGATVTMDGENCREARIVLGAVAPTPVRARKAEELIQGRKWTKTVIESAAEQAVEESRPISDVRASAEYRKKMVGVMTLRALKEAHERAVRD